MSFARATCPVVRCAASDMPQQKHWKQLTPEEASRALYIDFEGQQDKPPVLLGVTRWSKPTQLRLVNQVICGERFAPLAQVGGLAQETLRHSRRDVLLRAKAHDRRIVAWTEHERKVVKTYCPEHL